MSIDKTKSAKNITYSDRYSKNPILNTLIKNKLETQMVAIKESFGNIIKKEEGDKDRKTGHRIALRKNKSYSINPKSIAQAVQYDPIQRLNSYTQTFISTRQHTSPFFQPQHLHQINQSRQQHTGLTTKLSKADIIHYSNSIDLKELSGKVEADTVRDYRQEVWLPTKPEVLHLVEERREVILGEDGDRKAVEKEMEKFANRITGLSFTGSFQSFPLSSLKPPSKPLKPTTYTAQKYHKNDYKLLQSWLQSTIQSLSKQSYPVQQKLNLLYSAYICVWKELIRLTYIQSEEKGLIVEKMLYSMLRLFWGIVSEQQELGRVFRREMEGEFGEVRGMMEGRMAELDRRYAQVVKENQELKQINHRLSKVFISYEKVNHELVDELEKITSEKKKIERQFYNIGNSFYKTLQLLYDKKLIQMDFMKQESDPHPKKNQGPEYKTYFLFDKSSRPTILGRFKLDDTTSPTPYTPTHNPNPSLSPTHAPSQQQTAYNKRYGHNLKQIQNELTRYWQKKQNDLEIKGIINSLIMEVKIKDAGCGTETRLAGDFACQFPELGEDYVERLLGELRKELIDGFQLERKQYLMQIQQKEAVFQRWKASAEQLQQKNKLLHETNQKLTQTSKKSKQSTNQLLKQIDQIAKTITLQKLQSQQLAKTLQLSKMSQVQAKINETNADKQRLAMKAELDREKENNRMLVRGNLEAKQKVEKLDIRYGGLLKAVKGVAPWLEKFMHQVDKPAQQIDLSVLRTVSAKIEEHLPDYVTKDSSLFMTRLT